MLQPSKIHSHVIIFIALCTASSCENKQETTPCPEHSTGAPACACTDGFKGDLTWDEASESWSGSCEDIDECAEDNGGCGDSTFNTCTNNEGSAPTCTDIDECAKDNGGCGENSTCTNKKNGPPTCTCNNGFMANPDGACTKIPACQFVKCGVHAVCQDGECVCDAGYTGDAKTACTDIDECAKNNGGCGDATFTKCVNNQGGAPTCEDIDECAENNGGCGENEVCNNLKNQAPKCTCADGHMRNPDGACVVVPACQFVKCGENSACSEGKCLCKDGYRDDGAGNCVATDACVNDNGGCGDPNFTRCINNPGTKPTCQDINECETNNGGCDVHATCTNRENQAPECTCKAGYKRQADGSCKRLVTRPSGPPNCSLACNKRYKCEKAKGGPAASAALKYRGRCMASCQKAVQSKDTRKMGFYRKLERCAKKSCEAYAACAR